MGRRLALGSGLEVPVTLAHGVSSGPPLRSRRANSKKKLLAYCCRIPYIYAHSYDYYNSLYTRADNWSVFIVVFTVLILDSPRSCGTLGYGVHQVFPLRSETTCSFVWYIVDILVLRNLFLKSVEFVPTFRESSCC